MKVTVSKYLNVRVGEPSLDAPNYQYLAPGSVIEVDGKLYEGQDYDGNTLWFRDKANNYYWSGGVEYNNTHFLTDIANTDLWFHKLKINEIWNQYNEKGNLSSVLVLDTGINNLSVFESQLNKPVLNFHPNSKTVKCEDKDHHGTHCSGLIISNSSKFNIGIAPQAKLYVGKVNKTGNLKDATTLKLALSEYLKPKYENTIDIISISQTLINPDDELELLINRHLEMNRIVVAAIGNDIFRENLNTKKYPGFYKGPLSVGACENDGRLSNYTCYPSKADIFCYGSEIMSYKNSEIPLPLTGTSQATAIVSGITALVVSYLKKRNIEYDCNKIKALYSETSITLNSNDIKILNPIAIFKNIA